ncbi:hypothetical protein QJU96_04540 [Pasteurella skyensis]|uniref:Uncharacterized protein n=1 Tax=Phocoenobacter skyensis TaxID=97481 RepID=A0AAJ6P2B3_9PAST|nr:hypothetical protein [Pasteurella skyensis]MDP8170556.1 hypothetical protein [Pasteurella skyensis]MDP8174617.1 hypothetical protein [Pasteurella skyensis]
MAVNIYCPLCGHKTNTRTSDRPTDTTVTAQIYCPSCGDFKGDFVGEISRIKTAKWNDDAEIKNGINEDNLPKYRDV